jgi:hypothetical protein
MLPQQTPGTTALPICDYVTDLQLHMTLQARHLLPSLDTTSDDHRLLLLQRTQADVETTASRLWL